MIDNTGSGAIDSIVIMLDIAHQVFTFTVSKKNLNKFFEFTSNIIVSVKFGVIKYFVKNVACENMLNHHFANISFGYIWIYFDLTQFKESCANSNKVFIPYTGLINTFTERFYNCRNISLKFF